MNGFVPLGIIEHQSRIVRSVRIDDRLFAISDDMVSVHQLDNPALKLGMIDLSSVSERHMVELAMAPLAMPIEAEPLQWDLMQLLATSSAETTLSEPPGPWWIPFVERKSNESAVHTAIFPIRPAVLRVDAAVVQLLADEMARSVEPDTNSLPAQQQSDGSGQHDEPDELGAIAIELSTRVSSDVLSRNVE